MPDSCAGISFTRAMALSCHIACEGVSLSGAMALLCGRVGAVAKAVSRQSCTDVSRR